MVISFTSKYIARYVKQIKFMHEILFCYLVILIYNRCSWQSMNLLKWFFSNLYNDIFCSCSSGFVNDLSDFFLCQKIQWFIKLLLFYYQTTIRHLSEIFCTERTCYHFCCNCRKLQHTRFLTLEWLVKIILLWFRS